MTDPKNIGSALDGLTRLIKTEKLAMALINALQENQVRLYMPDLSQATDCITCNPETFLEDPDDENTIINTTGIRKAWTELHDHLNSE